MEKPNKVIFKYFNEIKIDEMNVLLMQGYKVKVQWDWKLIMFYA